LSSSPLPPILDLVRTAAAKRILFTPHAIRQMARPQRMITRTDVETVVAQGVLVEDYPEDVRGHSCLVLGTGEGDRPLHVVCSPKGEYLTIVTAYIPDPAQWLPDFTRRRSP
jgi:Domain of unknown function (DUF4258)